LYFELENDGFFILRPSGTEPKIKLYFSVVGTDDEDAQKQLNALRKAVKDLLA